MLVAGMSIAILIAFYVGMTVIETHFWVGLGFCLSWLQCHMFWLGTAHSVALHLLVLVVLCTYWVEGDLLVAFSWLHVVLVLVVALCGLTSTV